MLRSITIMCPRTPLDWEATTKPAFCAALSGIGSTHGAGERRNSNTTTNSPASNTTAGANERSTAGVQQVTWQFTRVGPTVEASKDYLDAENRLSSGNTLIKRMKRSLRSRMARWSRPWLQVSHSCGARDNMVLARHAVNRENHKEAHAALIPNRQLQPIHRQNHTDAYSKIDSWWSDGRLNHNEAKPGIKLAGAYASASLCSYWASTGRLWR